MMPSPAHERLEAQEFLLANQRTTEHQLRAEAEVLARIHREMRARPAPSPPSPTPVSPYAQQALAARLAGARTAELLRDDERMGADLMARGEALHRQALEREAEREGILRDLAAARA